MAISDWEPTSLSVCTLAEFDGVHDSQAGVGHPSSTTSLIPNLPYENWAEDWADPVFIQSSNDVFLHHINNDDLQPWSCTPSLSSGQTSALHSSFQPLPDFDFTNPLQCLPDPTIDLFSSQTCLNTPSDEKGWNGFDVANPLRCSLTPSLSYGTIPLYSTIPPLAAASSECGWKHCSSTSSCSTSESRAHLKLHAEEARERRKCAIANGDMKCTWSGCKGKAHLTTEKQFEQHLINIHINRLVCTVKKCAYRKPFRAKHDLRRHIDTAHSGTSKYLCPFDYCKKGFTRKDKWSKHLYDHHDTELCPYSHCPDENFVVGPGKSTAEHIAKMHGIFECGLDGCKDGRVSGFSGAGLSEHLQVVHNMEWATVLRARASAKSKGDTTLRIDHIS